ncbi:MAG: endonuclease III [Elusimicrobiota bacterium]|jgi:endonuclease-3|nr:endonuclease III [Elusimicrobiota bacterium]
MKNEKKYILEIIKILDKEYKDVDIALNYSNAFELLAATILSAQCTDEQVNKVTQNLFRKYKTIGDYAKADIIDVENIVHSTGFYRNKAKNIVNAAKIILQKYGGKIPQTMEELIELPGVARKTANIVLGHAFNKPVGIAVDTHVIRISNILQLTREKDPVKIEKDLMKITPREFWIRFPILIQTLGRRVCKARNPNHSICPLSKLCPENS